MTERLTEDIRQLSKFVPVGNDAHAPSNIITQITNRIKPNMRSKVILNYDEGSTSLSDVFDMSNGTIVQENLNEFRTMSMNRYRQYVAYEEMAQDPIISTALDMYADDATQTDANGDRMWVSSSDPRSEAVVGSIFEKLNIRNHIWKITRLLAEYGDVYLELFYDSEPKPKHAITEVLNAPHKSETINLHSTNGHILNDVRIVTDVENMFDLVINGETVAYAKLKSDYAKVSDTGIISPRQESSDIQYYPADKFIHLYIDQSDRRDADYFKVNLDNQSQLVFEVRRGKSMIHDLYSNWRDLQLLEYSIMLNRAARSSIFRFVQVEVGNMSKSNVTNTMRKVKNLIESKLSMNTNTNLYRPYSDPGPIENYVYIPVKEGKGAISVDTVGGDVNIRDLADLEYYQNKMFSGLKIPKEFLNYSEGNSLFNSGAALTKLDARYARTIKRLQSFIVMGLTSMVDLFLINKGLSTYLDTYKITTVVPSTLEDADRLETFNTKLTLMNDMTDALNNLAEATNSSLDVEAYVEYLSDSVFGESFLKEVIKFNEDPSESSLDMTDMNMGNDFTSNSLSSGAADISSNTSSTDGTDFDLNTDEPVNDIGVADTPSPEPDTDAASSPKYKGEWDKL